MRRKARKPARGGGSRSRFLVVSLVLLVGLAGVLTFQAQDAARSHRAMAERALRDYARVAVWGLSGNLQDGLYTLLYSRLDAVWGQVKHPVLGGTPLAQSRGARASDACHCLQPNGVGTRFVLAPDGTLTADQPLPDRLRTLIRDNAARWPGAPRDNWELGVMFPPGDSRVIGYARRSAGKPAEIGTVVGFVATRASFSQLFGKLVEIAPMLPSPLLHGGSNDSTFSVEVLASDGSRLYQTPHIYDAAFSATDRMRPFFGGLLVRVAVRPAAAAYLVIGGLPPSRLPLLLSVLALSMVLAVVALLQLRREAELARMREDFVSSVSHELRTPLAQIRMFAETLLLGRTRSEAERRRSLEIIDQEARRLSALVENVLQYSRASRGVTRVAPETADLTAEVAAIVEGFRIFAAQKRMELRAELQDGVMGVVDRGALRQMLNNLMENAVKYGPPAQRILVGLAVFGDVARMWVDDEGPGIPAAEREKVFQPFYRSPREAGSAVAGSGIGLAVVRELATLHAGRVWAEEAPGGGARLSIEIPGAYVRTPVPAGDTAAA